VGAVDRLSTIGGEALKGHLDLILLSTLERGPAYGYLIVSQLDQDSEGRLRLSDGTIYPALHRLERAQRLTSFFEVSAGRRRRVYRITPAGEDELERLRSEWTNFSTAIQQVLNARQKRITSRRHDSSD
jgi:DNA-binding PadR family transcriptional regulator